MSKPKRKASQAPQAAEQQPRKRGRRTKRKNDVYEAHDSDPDEDKRAYAYDKVDNFEYELPSDFEDEEIDEEAAFTEEDKKKYASWFGEDAGGAAAGQSDDDEFADLNSSDGEQEEEEDEEGDEELMFEDGDGGDADLDGAGAGEQLDSEPSSSLEGESGDEGLEEEEDDFEDEDGEGEEGEEGLQDDERYRDMLAAALGSEAGGTGRSRSKKRKQRVVSEAYPESEFNVASTLAAAAGENGALTLSDMLAGLGEARSSLGASRKLIERLDKKAAPVDAPLPRSIRERVERKAGYEHTSKDITKWQPIVKANREAPTLQFTAPTHEVSKTASVAAIVEKFAPETDMEAEVAALLEAAGAHTAAAMAEAEEALALKSLSLDEARARQERLAKMRHLLFYSELKAKRLSKIKSKAFHRQANRAAKRKVARLGEVGGDEAEKEAAEEAEFERAKERLTLKHKNTSKWARRALRRGVDVMDEGTKAAIAEQLALGVELRRKIEGRAEGSASDTGTGSETSASDDDEAAEGAAPRRGTGLSAKDRSEALAILSGLQNPNIGEDGEPEAKPKGLFALPFMARALERRRQQAAAEAAQMLAEMEGVTGDGDAGDGLLGGDGGFGAAPSGTSGRLKFGAGSGGVTGDRGDDGAAGDGSDDSGGEEEDAEAKAERLGRKLRGEAPLPRQQRQQQQQEEGQGPPSSSGRAVSLSAASAGPVAVEMPARKGTGRRAAGTVNGVAANGAAANGAAAAAAANGTAAADSAGAGLLQDVAAAQQHDRQQWLFGEGAARAAAISGSRAQGQADAADGPSTSAPAAFVPAKTFGGVRAGYVFKRGPSGVGYYQDAGAAAGQQQNGKGTKGKGRKGKQGAQQQQQQERQNGVLKHQQQPANGHAVPQQPNNTTTAVPAPTKAAAKAAAKAAKNAATNAAADANNADAGDHMQLLSGGADEQQALIRAAFAGDDVVTQFEADKAEEVGAELPSAEVPGVMPGWGLWAGKQTEPKWVKEARDKAEGAKAKAAASRKDARLKHVVISEKWDKKAAKFGAAVLPFPFTSKDVYEASLRQSMGRETNPDVAFRDLTRPAVLKSTGVIIQPLRYSKPVQQYSSTAAAKSRSVVTVAGGMQVEGKVAPGGKKGKQGQQKQQGQQKGQHRRPGKA